MTTITEAEPTQPRAATSERSASTLLASLKRRLSAIGATFVWDTTATNDWQGQVHHRDRWS